MPHTSEFVVYTTPTHTPGIGGRPNTPTFEPWLQPHEFHSYIPALSAKETRIVDEILAYGAPVYDVTEDMERLFLTPSKRRVDHSTPEEAFEARKWNKKPEFSLKPRPSTYDEEYTTFRLREPILTSPRGLVRTPLAELPKHEFAVRSRRSPKESLTTHTQASRAAAPVARRTPPARSSTRGHQLNPVTPPAQSAQVRVTPSTSNSSQSSISVCSICGSTYVCSRCSPNTSIQSSRSSMPSSSSSQNSASSQSRAELDRNVRKMERLAAKGRKLRDLIPSMAASSDVPKTWRQKTEVEKWLEKEMAIQEHAYEH